MASLKRILLKISGEALMGSLGYGIEQEASFKVAKKIQELSNAGYEVGIVPGGGNIFRGIQQGALLEMERTPADHIGLLATMMNGIALREVLLQVGCDTRLMSALDCPTIAEKYNWEQAMRHFSKRRVVIFAGGTGHPFFTTDTAAALRASEIQANIFLKATTRVDGIYNKDPRLHKDAIKYEHLSYKEILDNKLGILDLTAVTLCMNNHIPICVFNLFAGSLLDVISGRSFGTLVSGE